MRKTRKKEKVILENRIAALKLAIADPFDEEVGSETPHPRGDRTVAVSLPLYLVAQLTLYNLSVTRITSHT